MFSFKKIFAIFGLFVIASLQIAQANPQLEKAIQGRWYSEMTEEIPADEDLVNGVLKVVGVDEYLGNGSVNMQGQLIMTFNYKNGNQIIASWLVNAASEWQIKNGYLYEKVVDVRASPDFVKINGKPASVEDQKEFFQQSEFKIEDLIPKGHTSEDEIILINEKTFTYKTKNDDGVKEIRNKNRTNSAFSLYRIK